MTLFPGITQNRRAALFAWGMMAIINLSMAIVIASWPERQADLDTMRGWGAEWLFRARNIYAVEQAWPEYPPHAIVVLSPLAALPDGWAVPVWAGFNLALALFATYIVVRAVRLTLTPRPLPLAPSDAALPMLMFLCWGGFRALLQFSLLSLTFGLLSMRLAEKRPAWSGIWLGLALMKPQMSIPFFLWALFTRRFRILAIATSVVAAGFAVYCLRVQANPVQVAVNYAEIVNRYYVGDAILYGLAQPRPLIELLARDLRVVDAVVVSFAFVTLAIVFTIGFLEAKTNRYLLYAAPPLVGLWSLLTFYHLTYGFLLLLPLAAALLFDDEPATRVFRRRLFWALQLTMMFDVTVLWRWFGHLVPSPAVGQLLIHADRLVIPAFFVCVLGLAVRTLRNTPSLQRVL